MAGQGGYLNVLSRDGGAWLVTSSSTRGLEFQPLDSSGNAAGASIQVAGTSDLAGFVVGGDGKKWVGVLGVRGSSSAVVNGDVSLKLQLFSGAALTPAGEVTLSAPGDVSCGVIFPYDLDIQELANGDVAIALVRTIGRAIPTADGCNSFTATGSTDLIFVTYTHAHTWSQKTIGMSRTDISGFGATTPIYVSKAPCSEQWYGGYAGASGNESALRLFGADGQEAANLDPAAASITSMADLNATPLDCSKGDFTLAAVYAQGQNSVRARRWSATGSPSQVQQIDDFSVADQYLAAPSLLGSHGRLFVSGLDLTATPHIYELNARGSTARPLGLNPLAQTDSSMPSMNFKFVLAAGANAGARFVRLADLDASLVAAVPYLPTLTTGLEAHRKAGDTNPPVGATYKLGCLQ